MTLTLQKRIALTLVPLLALLLVLGSAGVVLLYRLGTRIDAILRENYDSVIAMEHLGDALERIDSSFQFTLAGREATARVQYEGNWKTYREHLRVEQGNITLPGEKELVDELTALTERYEQQGESFYARTTDDPRRSADYFDAGGLLETFTKIKSVAGQIARINQDNMEEAGRDAHRTAVASVVGFATGLAVCMALTAFAAWHIFHAVLGPVRAVTQSVQGISTGNLDQVVPYLSGDALGQLAQAFNHMARRLREERQSTEVRTRELVQTTETLRTEISEREQMERELRQMAAIIESSDDAIVSQSLDGLITSWNKGAERIFGHSANWIVGQPQSILVPPEQENELPAIRARILRGEHVDHFETIRKTKDGRRIFVWLTVSPVQDETGQVIGVATIARDITERKRAEDALHRAAAYNRRLLEASLDPLVTIGPDGKITDVNVATERATGCCRSELVGTDFADYFTEPAQARSGYQQVFSEGSVRDYPLELRHRDGRVTSVLYNAAVFRDEIGNVVGVFAAARDITERKKAEEALRTSEENLKQAQSVAHIGSWYLNIPRNELLWSDETYRIFGMPPGTPMNYEKFLAIVHPDDRDLVSGAWNAAMHGAPYDLEHRLLVGGHTRWIREQALLEFDADGHVVSGIGTAHDITERRKAEEEVRRLAQLQSAIAELGQRALRTESTGSLLEEAVGVVAGNLDVDFCNVLELLPDGEELLLRAGVGWKDGLVGHATVKSQGTQPGYVICSECPVIVEDAATETRFALLPRLLGENVVSAMSVVISTPEGPYGALGVHSRRRRAFTQDEVHFLQAVANVLGSAIEQKRAEERLRRSNRALLALSNCNQALIRSTDETALLQQICQIVVEQAGYLLCWVGYAEHDEAKSVRPVAQAGFEEDYLKTADITWADTERGHGPTGTCIRTGQMFVVKDIATEARFAPWRADALKRGYASCVGIPLIADSSTLGALSIYAAEPNAFSDEEVKLLTELAGDLAFGVMTLRTRAERKKAVELQAAREREIKIGSEIQRTLLIDPLPTDLRGLHVAALSVPSQQIDGDFYYFYKHEDQRVDLIVADVMGKGIPAALLGAATKSHFLEALCHLLDTSPAGVSPPPKDIVTLAHAVMVQHLIDLESFVTLCYVCFVPGGRTVEFVDAGHTGLIHCHAGGDRCEVLHGDNLPLGFRKGETYSQQSVTFEMGDLLVLFSDGVTEARNRAGELFGEGRLRQCIESNSALEPEGLAKAIRNAVFAFAESESPTDDLTCVVIRIVESERPQVRATLEIRSDFRELERSREFVRAFCRDLPGTKLDDEYVGELELAVTEACSNIIKHAYQRRSDQWIRLEAEGFPDRISIRLHHLGGAFDPSNVPLPRLDGSQESGFGVYLITQSVDVVRYYRDEWGRNCIALTKNRWQPVEKGD